LVDELVIEIASVGKLDILHLLQQRHGAGALSQAEQRHLAPSPATLPALTMRKIGNLGTRPSRTALAGER